MKKTAPAIIVVSCDRYSDLWEPFFTCFFKYWSSCPYKVYLGTNLKSYDDPRVTSLAIGEDKSYSENLSAMLFRIPEEWVVFWVDDRFVSGAIETEEVKRLISLAQELEVASLKLIPEHPLAYQSNEYGIGLVPKGTAYRVSMTVALWKRERLQDLLVAGESAWELEKKGTVRSSSIQEPFYGLAKTYLTRPPIPHIHTLVKGKIIRSALGFLQKEDLLPYFRFREIEPMTSVIYTWAFRVCLRLAAPVLDKIATYRNYRSSANF